MNEKQLIDRVIGGDTSAFGYFVDQYQDLAVTIAFRLCRNRQDAEDIVQNAFVKAFHNLHTFRATSKFSTWFYRIVYNTAITEVRSRKMTYDVDNMQLAETSDTFVDWGAIQTIERKERESMLESAMQKMPPDESLLLSLYYLEENSVKEIADIVGLTDSNIKVKLHRARKRLAALLEPVLQH